MIIDREPDCPNCFDAEHDACSYLVEELAADPDAEAGD